MNAYNPLTATKRMEAAGLPRLHAEAIASEIDDGVSDLVTKEYFREHLDAALAKNTVRLGGLVFAIVAAATAVLGLLITLK